MTSRCFPHQRVASAVSDSLSRPGSREEDTRTVVAAAGRSGLVGTPVQSEALFRVRPLPAGDVVIDRARAELIDSATGVSAQGQHLLDRQGRKLTFRSPSRLPVLPGFGLADLIEDRRRGSPAIRVGVCIASAGMAGLFGMLRLDRLVAPRASTPSHGRRRRSSQGPKALRAALKTSLRMADSTSASEAHPPKNQGANYVHRSRSDPGDPGDCDHLHDDATNQGVVTLRPRRAPFHGEGRPTLAEK